MNRKFFSLNTAKSRYLLLSGCNHSLAPLLIYLVMSFSVLSLRFARTVGLCALHIDILFKKSILLSLYCDIEKSGIF